MASDLKSNLHGSESLQAWVAMENAIACKLEAEEAASRNDLLAAIATYARAVLVEAKREPAPSPPPNIRASVLRWLEFPIFICGHHRSGTTLLQQLLDGHPQLVVVPGEGTLFSSFKYLVRSSPPKADIERFAVNWVERFVDPNFEPHFKLGRTEDTNPSVDFVRRLLMWGEMLRASRPALRRVVPLMALAAAYQGATEQQDGIRGWVDKTPLNEKHMKRLTLFKQARFIHLIRHPPDTLASLSHAMRRAGVRFNAAEHLEAIARSFKLASQNQRLYPDRYLIVRYEDLVSDAQGTMEYVRQFLSLSPSASLTVPTSAGSTVRSNSSFERSEPGVVGRSHQKPAISEGDSFVIAALTASVVRVYGYSVQRVPWAAKIGYRLRASFGSYLTRAFAIPARVWRRLLSPDR